MKPCAKMLVVIFFLAVLVPELVLSSKKARKLHLHRSNDSMSKAFTRILDGTDAQPGEFPWYALLLTKDKTLICGGTLIHPRVVLTAAHCVRGRKPFEYSVRLGALKSKNDPVYAKYVQDINVLVHIDHYKYNASTYSNDVALVYLARTFKENYFVKMIKLPRPGDHALAAKCVIMGFGATNAQGTTFPERLQKLDISIVGRDKCKAFDESLICTERPGPGNGPCWGDSGGPLVCKHNADGSGDYYLHAIINGGPIPCGKVGKLDGYVDVVKILEWIANSYFWRLV